jgi:hypothetical protein
MEIGPAKFHGINEFDKNTSPKVGKSSQGGYYKPKLLK